MDGEKRLVVIVVGLVALCITVLYVFLLSRCGTTGSSSG
jgi:hypothetical protein